MPERKYMFLDRNRPETIASLISQALDTAIRETGKKQVEIAKIIGVNRNTLTNWRKGRTVPSDRDFNSFLNFLGQLNPPIGEDFFTGAYKNEPDVDDPAFVAAMSEELGQYAKEIGLNLNFLRFVLDLIKGAFLEDEFYHFQWGPIQMKENSVPSDPEKLNVHERLIQGKSSTAKAAGDFRIGDRILTKADLKAIVEIQDRIFEEVALRLIKRGLDMGREVRMADQLRKEKYLRAKEESGDAEVSKKDMVLTVGELGEIDQYFKMYMKGVPDDTLITDIPWDSIEM